MYIGQLVLHGFADFQGPTFVCSSFRYPGEGSLFPIDWDHRHSRVSRFGIRDPYNHGLVECVPALLRSSEACACCGDGRRAWKGLEGPGCLEWFLCTQSDGLAYKPGSTAPWHEDPPMLPACHGPGKATLNDNGRPKNNSHDVRCAMAVHLLLPRMMLFLLSQSADCPWVTLESQYGLMRIVSKHLLATH